MRISDWSSDVCSSDLGNTSAEAFRRNSCCVRPCLSDRKWHMGAMELDDFPTGELMRLSPLVGRVLAPNPSPFTYTGTQTYVVGQAELAVIDPGPDHPSHLEALLRVVAGRPLKRSEEHTSELQSLMRISYAVFCLK